MGTLSRRTLLAMVGMAPFARPLLARASSRESSPERTTPREMIKARYFPNVILRTHEDKEVRFYDDLLKNKIVTINFMYTACGDGVCPATTANLVQVQKLLGDRVGRDIFIYSITLQPKHDTPEVLAKYAKGFGVGPGWWFLTGKPGDIELLRRSLGQVDPDPVIDADKSQHIGMIRFGNEALQLWAGVPGASNPRWIAKSICWVDPSTKRKC